MNMSTSKAAKAADSLDDEVETLAAQMTALRKEVRALVDQIGAVGSAAQSEATVAARAKAAKGIEAGEQVAAGLMDDWRGLDRKVVAATRDSPWRTLGVAALVGLILGLILRR